MMRPRGHKHAGLTLCGGSKQTHRAGRPTHAVTVGMCICECVCVRVRVRVRAYDCVRVLVCVSVTIGRYTRTHIHTHTLAHTGTAACIVTD
jgi:hypothetical protein